MSWSSRCTVTPLLQMCQVGMVEVGTDQPSRSPHRAPAPPVDPLVVDGGRPAVQWVAALPRDWVTHGERLVLLALACDAYGNVAAPGADNLAAWTGMFRSSVHGILDRLTRPTPRRPPLLAKRATRGRHRTRYVLLVDTPSGGSGSLGGDELKTSPNGPGNGVPNCPAAPNTGLSEQPAGDAGSALSLGNSLTLPDGESHRHAHEPNAVAALRRIRGDRRLLVSEGQLLEVAYEVGRGDPWLGYQHIRDRTEDGLSGAHDPLRVLRHRLQLPAANQRRKG